MRFFLGTHQPNWLHDTAVPLFVSHRRLARQKSFTRAKGPWALDSGGFSELSLFGEWRTSQADYVAAVRRYVEEIGKMAWAAPQDWMCEPPMIEKTGLSVREHQRRTVESVLSLRAAAPEIHWIPVLQGWNPAEYRIHAEDYALAGIDLACEEEIAC